MWKPKYLSIASLHLDSKNPRLGREIAARAPREIVQFLFDHDKALDVAESIATRGFFFNEPLLAIMEDEKFVVVEGNRRLAALKALREPGLLEGSLRRKVERLVQRMGSQNVVRKVPVILAPDRRSTDKQVAGKHVGTPVLAWQAENRASFILDKLEEGYSDDDLRDNLNFTLADIQAARQTRAIADMARSLDLPEEIMAKINDPRARLFSTIERVIKSPEGRQFLMIEPDSGHGLRGTTTKTQFLKGFKKLVADVALGKETSRTLNKGKDIDRYFGSWEQKDIPENKRGSFVPGDIIKGGTAGYPAPDKPKPRRKPQKPNDRIIPKTFKVRVGHERLTDIRGELIKLKRSEYPNIGAVMMRVFLELSIVDYLKRKGRMEPLVSRLERKNQRLRFDTPDFKQLAPEMIKIAKQELSKVQANLVEKALTYNDAAPFSISELHGFVHQMDFPTESDIRQFWNRTEPLFKLMLEDE